MGSQFSEEFLLGYRAGHRDGFADAVLLMRDAVTPHKQAHALAQREARLQQLLSGEVPVREDGQAAKTQAPPSDPERAMAIVRGGHRKGGDKMSPVSEGGPGDGPLTPARPERS
jgi:hypothetical protein